MVCEKIRQDIQIVKITTGRLKIDPSNPPKLSLRVHEKNRGIAIGWRGSKYARPTMRTLSGAILWFCNIAND